MIDEAIEHSLAAKEYPNIVRLVENIALSMILQAQVRTVERWLKAVPQEYLEKSPRINMAIFLVEFNSRRINPDCTIS